MYELIFWGALFIVLVIAESISLQLVSIWFAVGSAAAFIASLFHAPILSLIHICRAGGADLRQSARRSHGAGGGRAW